ncbi:flagellar biosynthetic protein FliO [Idiomarina seosinensis]|uniref:flagellar biosynthetic protein FliO n=1 Tax=Idiomarina seosinensis TaxID=281739 RepID=UPI00385040CB
MLLSPVAAAQKTEAESPLAGTDIGAMLLALIVVLAVIIGLAAVVKRFNLKLQANPDMKVISAMSLGTKERLIIVDVAGTKLLLGVTSERIECLRELPDTVELKGQRKNDPSAPGS